MNVSASAHLLHLDAAPEMPVASAPAAAPVSNPAQVSTAMLATGKTMGMSHDLRHQLRVALKRFSCYRQAGMAFWAQSADFAHGAYF